MVFGRNRMIKRLIAAILLMLMLPSLCGCSLWSVWYQSMSAYQQSSDNYPDDAQIQAYVESVVKGEKVQSVYGGGTEYRSLDRDLTFEVRINSLTTSLDGSFARETGKYYFTDTYELMVAAFWQDEFDAALNRHKFDYCFCNGPSELYPGSTGIEVYIDEDCSEEQLEEVEKLLMDLRDICIKE